MLLLGLPLPLLPVKLLLSLLRASGHVLQVLCLQKQGRTTADSTHVTGKVGCGPACSFSVICSQPCDVDVQAYTQWHHWVQCQAMPASACLAQSGHEQVEGKG
jgi:hypothetical protein